MPQKTISIFISYSMCLTYFMEYAHWIVYRFYGQDAQLSQIRLNFHRRFSINQRQQFLIYRVFFSFLTGCELH